MITALINNRPVILIGLFDNWAVNLIDLEHSTQCDIQEQGQGRH